MILLVDPNEESLGIVVVNTSALWPVPIQSTGFEEPVSFLKKEVISDELLSIIFRHLIERVILSLELSVEFFKSLGYLVSDFRSIGNVENSWSEWELG